MKTNTRHTKKTKPIKSTRTKMLQSGAYGVKAAMPSSLQRWSKLVA
jgi:hypothetical protein